MSENTIKMDSEHEVVVEDLKAAVLDMAAVCDKDPKAAAFLRGMVAGYKMARMESKGA